MKTFKLSLQCFIFSMILAACSTNPSAKLNSFPEGATVSVSSQNGSTRVIGKTPMEIPASELHPGSGTISSLSFAKDGFQSHHVSMIHGSGKENFEIIAKLQANSEDPKSSDLKQRQEKLAQKLVIAHNLITQKRLPEAESLLQEVIRDYPHISVGYDLLGNVSYLQRNLSRARSYYEKSIQINPENEGTRAMIKKISSSSEQI